MSRDQRSLIESAEVLVDQFLDNNLGLRPFCDCGNTVVITPIQLAAFSRRTTLAAIKARLKCSKCGAIGMSSAQIVVMSA